LGYFVIQTYYQWYHLINDPSTCATIIESTIMSTINETSSSKKGITLYTNESKANWEA